jgi:hypothetical protein
MQNAVDDVISLEYMQQIALWGEYIQKGSIDLHANFGGFMDLHACFGGKKSNIFLLTRV